MPLLFRAEAYAVALEIALHGRVHWVGPELDATSSNYYASYVFHQECM